MKEVNIVSWTEPLLPYSSNIVAKLRNNACIFLLSVPERVNLLTSSSDNKISDLAYLKQFAVNEVNMT